MGIKSFFFHIGSGSDLFYDSKFTTATLTTYRMCLHALAMFCVRCSVSSRIPTLFSLSSTGMILKTAAERISDPSIAISNL